MFVYLYYGTLINLIRIVNRWFRYRALIMCFISSLVDVCECSASNLHIIL